MTHIVPVAEVRAARTKAHDRIDAAFWTFVRSRGKAAKPPPIGVEDAHATRNRCDAVLRWVR